MQDLVDGIGAIPLIATLRSDAQGSISIGPGCASQNVITR
jgi:hypothetical protein